MMNNNRNLFKEVCMIAVPVAIQCMLQSSFGIVDQLMIGQLGTASIAAVGLAGKFVSIFTVVTGAVATVSGIMIAQNIGSQDNEEAVRSFSVNLLVMASIAVLFMLLAFLLPGQIMGIYSTDEDTIAEAVRYMSVIGISFLPLAINNCAATMFRCMDDARKPLYISIMAAIINTVLNYILIFGKSGFPAMGIKGAAAATSLSSCISMLFTVIMLSQLFRKKNIRFTLSCRLTRITGKEYMLILMPILLNEFLWSIGENIYGIIYGHLGTAPCAAMTLTYPIQGLLIGALSGISSAAGIIIGKRLGKTDYEAAYEDSKMLVWYGLAGSAFLSVILIIFRNYYVSFYQIEQDAQMMGSSLLLIFACYLPVKVTNMILGGGILRSGGNTKLILAVDLIGTWLIGVPVGLFTAFVLKLSVIWVYALLSTEEAARLAITIVLFGKRSWMRSL